MKKNCPKTIKVSLTRKEVFLLWAIICWFDSPLASYELKANLFHAFEEMVDGDANQTRNRMGKKYDKKIMQQLAETGYHIKTVHPEWLDDTKKET